MTVKEAVSLISSYQDFVLVGARTGKRLYSSRHNNKKRLMLFENKEVTEKPFFSDVESSKEIYLPHRTEYMYPVVNIWVSGC